MSEFPPVQAFSWAAVKAVTAPLAGVEVLGLAASSASAVAAAAGFQRLTEGVVPVLAVQ